MTFSDALASIRNGKLATRALWHGEVFIYLETAMSVAFEPGHPLHTIATGGLLHPFVALKGHGTIAPWTPGQGDMLADDWAEVST